MTTWKQPEVMDDRDYTHIYLNGETTISITDLLKASLKSPIFIKIVASPFSGSSES